MLSYIAAAKYSFSHDPSVPRFRKIISRLEASFRSVHYPPGAMRRPCTVLYRRGV